MVDNKHKYKLPNFVPEYTVDIYNRIANIYERLGKIEGSLDKFATKEDLHTLTWRVITTAGALVAAVFYIARNVTPP